jgi:ferredoxin
LSLSIHVDRSKCMGSGNCCFWAPATFDLGDDGVAVVVSGMGDPPARIISAAKGCPTQAILVVEDGQPLS